MKRTFIMVEVTPQDKESIKVKARKVGLTMAAYCRMLILKGGK